MRSLAETLVQSRVKIPSPFVNPNAEAREAYTLYYKHSRIHDSPLESRKSLVERAYPAMLALPKGSWVLDLGSGRQAVEEEYNIYLAKNTEGGVGLPQCKILTLDIATLSREQLVGNGIAAIQANGDNLPFRENTLPMVISNMAFDFMQSEARNELYRVLQPNGNVFLNLHHPSMIPFELDSDLGRMRKKIMYKRRFGKVVTIEKELELDVLLHKTYLRDNSKLYNGENEIIQDFQNHGFAVDYVGLNNDRLGNKWWEVNMQKGL